MIVAPKIRDAEVPNISDHPLAQRRETKPVVSNAGFATKSRAPILLSSFLSHLPKYRKFPPLVHASCAMAKPIDQILYADKHTYLRFSLCRGTMRAPQSGVGVAGCARSYAACSTWHRQRKERGRAQKLLRGE